MFDVEELVAACQDAIRETEPRLAVRDVLERAVADQGAIAEVLPPSGVSSVPLHVSDELTVLKVVWAPGMVLGPHDHRMWAAIGIYSGGEDNRFFRRAGRDARRLGRPVARPGDVCLLGDDVDALGAQPHRTVAGAIHVYGGDFFATPRSEWRGEPPSEAPFDVDRVLESFAAANEEARVRGLASPTWHTRWVSPRRWRTRKRSTASGTRCTSRRWADTRTPPTTWADAWSNPTTSGAGSSTPATTTARSWARPG